MLSLPLVFRKTGALSPALTSHFHQMLFPRLQEGTVLILGGSEQVWFSASRGPPIGSISLCLPDNNCRSGDSFWDRLRRASLWGAMGWAHRRSPGRESCTWGLLWGSRGVEGGASRTKKPSSLPAVFRECLGDPRRDGNPGNIYQNSECTPWPKDQ